MNREILFRGKRVDSGEWVEGDLIHGVNHKRGKIFILPIEGGVSSLSSGIDPIDGWEVLPETVGHFTGLTDKNGTKICEGDKTKDGETVVFEEGIFGTTHEDNNQGISRLSEKRCKYIEIIKL